VDMMIEVLNLRAGVLREEFAIEVDSEDRLRTLPAVLASYCPDLDFLPEFLLRIAADVEWLDDVKRVTGVAEVRSTALFLTHFLYSSPDHLNCPYDGDKRLQDSCTLPFKSKRNKKVIEFGYRLGIV
jgi:hypothetical protein